MARISFYCDFSEPLGHLTHVWEHTVGSCHAPLTLRADWQTQLKRCHHELEFQYVRFHGLLSDDVGTFILHNEKPLYSFFNADQILEFLVSIGMKPFVELSFMPYALASGNRYVFKYRGNITPPRSYKDWGTLIHRLVKHWVDRFGIREVRQWFFEVWNEPNLKAFWAGSREDYFRLYRFTVDAIKEVDDSLKVGGPATAKNEWIGSFIDFCTKHKLPLDFVSTHHYPTDAFGKETDDTVTQLAASRRSVLREQAQNARREAGNLPLYYTEWNSSSNPRDPMHDEPYSAAFIVKTILEAQGFVDGYSFWTFSDIFEENYFPSVPFHGGFGLLSIHNIAKPSYRAFQLLHGLGTKRLLVDGIHETVDCWVISKGKSATVLLTNHAYPRHWIEKETVELHLSNVIQPTEVYVKRIDQEHCNPKKVWQRLGSPEYLREKEIIRLQEESVLTREHQPFQFMNGTLRLKLNLPVHSVAAVTILFE